LDIDFLRDLDRIVDLDAKVPRGAFGFLSAPTTAGPRAGSMIYLLDNHALMLGQNGWCDDADHVFRDVVTSRGT